MYYNEKLLYFRGYRNVAQKEIAEYLGINQQQYTRYEKDVNIIY